MHQYIKNNWKIIKEKRKKRVEELVKSLKEVGRINTFQKRWEQIYLLSEIRWFWDKTKIENFNLCTNCLEWDENGSNEFQFCQNNLHTIHKDCYKKCILKRLFNDGYCDHIMYPQKYYLQHHICLICNPLRGSPIGYGGPIGH